VELSQPGTDHSIPDHFEPYKKNLLKNDYKEKENKEMKKG